MRPQDGARNGRASGEMIGAEPTLLIAVLLILTVAVFRTLLRRRRRKNSAPQAQDSVAKDSVAKAPVARKSMNVELEHGAALRENMERMRQDAPFRRRRR